MKFSGVEQLQTPLLLDGGMGRELWYRGVDVPKTIWSANALLIAPDVVRDIHRDYIAAGADIITTNTYAAVRETFEEIGIGGRFEELMVLACQLAEDARDLADRPIVVAGSLPPLQESYRPDLVGPVDNLLSLYKEQVDLMTPYVDFFLCETMSSSDESLAAATAASASGKPVWVSWTLDDHQPGCLKSGESIQLAAGKLAGLRIEGMLANCCKPESITASMPDLVATGARYVGGYANTFETPPPGWTLELEGILGLRADLGPEPYAKHVQHWLDAGANVIGGCCGTRSAHISRLRELIRRL